MSATADWPILEAALDELLVLPESKRAAELERIVAKHPELRDSLTSLLRHAEVPDRLLDQPAIQSISLASETTGSLSPGSRVGAYCITSLLGRGGMGEVYRAQRADGHFEQTVALKLVRAEAGASFERFNAERQILAQLEHPCIARLLDGGVAPDGRPYMAMEYIEGEDLLSYCDSRAAPLAKRLRLFIQVCEAVAYAHTHLVVHRDLKPSNIFVTADEQVKLLDFGIAKLLQSDPRGDATHTLQLSPAHAAPEQLAGGAITTATDVYALGVTLYVLLCGRLPWDMTGMPLAVAVRRMLSEVPRTPSAALSEGMPVSVRELRGDLDAIITKAMRPEPGTRYPDARALADDLIRHLQHEPVQARAGARAYVLRRFVRRNVAAISAVGAVFVALLVGIGGIAWEAAQARHEAARANATKDFLVSIFRATDPRIASDKPREQITAKELMDVGAGRIEREFTDEPELKLELLRTLSSIYRELPDPERYAALQERELQLARQISGDLHPAVADILMDRAEDAVDATEYAAALQLLDQADGLIRRGGRDQTPARARWWLIRGGALIHDPSAAAERQDALEQSIHLFGRVAPHDPSYVTALVELGNTYDSRLEEQSASEYYRKALAVDESVPDRNDGEELTIYGNLGMSLSYQGDFGGADHAFAAMARIAEQTYGKTVHQYWVPAARYARTVHQSGQRLRALGMFEELMRYLPPEAGSYATVGGLVLHDAAETREWYGSVLAMEGRPRLGVPLLEWAERQYHEAPEYSYEIPRVRLALGDAYDGAGRKDDARRTLRAALDERVSTSPADSQVLMAARERWGRFLTGQGELAEGEAQFREVIRQAHGRNLSHVALAQGGIARVDIAKGDVAAAMRDAQMAADTFDHVLGFRDVRMGPYLWRICARAQLLAGHAQAARTWAQRALDASLSYDAPESSSIEEARALLRSIPPKQ